jgi:plastocyanin
VITDVNIIPTDFTFAFSPSTVVITAGTTVAWMNNTGSTHTSTSDITGTVTSWDSLGIAPGGVFTQTFTTPGAYTYHCAIHPNMMGSVTVIAPVIYMPILYRESVL